MAVLRLAALSICLGLAGCDGELVNLGSSESAIGGGAGGAITAPSWLVQSEPILAQEEQVLANPTLTADESELYYTAQQQGPDRVTGVFRALSSGSGFGAGAGLGLGTLQQVDVSSPAVAGNGGELWLSMLGDAGTDIWRSLRSGDGWSTPELVSELNVPDRDDAARPPGAGGSIMPLSSKRHGGIHYQIYLSTRAAPDAPWSTPSRELLAAIDEDGFQSSDGFLSDDGLTLCFASNRDGSFDLYVSERRSLAAVFGAPLRLSDVSTPAEERMPWLSGDGRRLYFSSNRSGQYALYIANRP